MDITHFDFGTKTTRPGWIAFGLAALCLMGTVYIGVVGVVL